LLYGCQIAIIPKPPPEEVKFFTTKTAPESPRNLQNLKAVNHRHGCNLLNLEILLYKRRPARHAVRRAGAWRTEDF